MILVRDEPARDRYELTVDGAHAGMAQYRLRRSRTTVCHTEVDAMYAGRGLGEILARDALQDIRRRGLQLVPTCPFIAAYVRRHPNEWLDLVAPALREDVVRG